MKKAMSRKGKAPAKKAPVYHSCPIFMFGLGNRQVVYVTKPDVVKHMTTCTSLDFSKPGILTLNGAVWAHQRKILAPELHMGKVKGMINLIVESTTILVNSWKGRVEMEGEVADIKIDEDLRSCSRDVISKGLVWEHLPTKRNGGIWALEKKVHNLILNVVKERKEAAYHGDDLLQMLIDGVKNSDISGDSLESFIRTTSWCLMLLASHPEWQAGVRDEVLQALSDIKLGDMYIPKGVNFWAFVLALQTDPKYGEQTPTSFNSERFVNGIAGACKFPHLYMPFVIGNRMCLGQSLAMVEPKITLALLLSNFSFSLSPKYYATHPLLGLL
ncbi:hypothetical protein PVL29_002623 [Vitis rotundifolia]|uniref:Cytochrome P450 n=1 Tax=Vitis rotundifolia TaxID=103349 RepID=A0AA39E306_VITRO|nr:hypothetical protein PVL29_002623 [Vitis rotundifolia]